ncbi:MAG: phosphoethanolamine transferase domain-containing protein, partial [Gammaproteobacteria bacterium]|nr:phosphoethanolamine transferase domain-containing protein [Gammaproteobacteria bacterium]
MKFNKIANFYRDIKQKQHTVDSVILWVAGFLLLFCNQAFFDNIIQQYSLSTDTFSFIVSLAIFLFALTVILLGLVSSRFTLKPLLIVVFFVAAVSSYFMNSYNIVVDTTMLTNVMETDAREAGDLLSVKLLLSLVFLGLLPSLWVLGLNLKPVTLRQALLSRVKLMLGAVMAIGVVVMLWSPYYASFFREHKHLRYYANPVTAIYSMGKFASENLHSDANITRQQIGLDAKIPDEDKDRELIILVLGETARADHFSLNGYSRKTNPLLENYPVVNF